MVDSVQRMVAADIQPILASHPDDRPLPKPAMLAIYRVLARQRLTAPRLPAEAGGGGMRMLDYGLVFEQLPPVVAFSLMAHEATASRLYQDHSEERRRRLLPPLLAGEKIACTATTEPDGGSDPRGMRTRLERRGDELVIHGRKLWITNGTIADTMMVTCRDGADERGRSRICRVVVEPARSSISAREVDVLGFRQGHLSEVAFDGTVVPAANELGESGDGARVLTQSWNVNRPLIGLMAVAMAQRAFDVAREYAGVRKQFGRFIGATQLVQQRLSDIAIAVETSRLLCYRALGRLDAGARANADAAMAKRYATEACQRAISDAIHVMGGIGISRELGLERLYRDVRMLPIPDATDEILTLIHGRELTGIDAFRG